MEQFDLFAQPQEPEKPKTRATDPETSFEAPATVDLDEIQRMVLDIASTVGTFTHYSMNNMVARRRKLAGRTPLEPQTVRSRVKELVDKKLCENTGKKERIFIPGKKRASNQTIWRITTLGQLRAAENAGRKLDRALVA